MQPIYCKYCVSLEHKRIPNSFCDLVEASSSSLQLPTTWWLFILVWDIEWVNAAGTMHLAERKQWPSVASGHFSRWARGARSRRTLGPWCNTSLRCRRSRGVVCRVNTYFNLSIALIFFQEASVSSSICTIHDYIQSRRPIITVSDGMNLNYLLKTLTT